MVIYNFKENILIIPDGVITENPVWQSGYTSGYTDGFDRGYDSGYTDGSAGGGAGYDSGYTDGYADGYDSGYTLGSEDGYDSGYTSGKTDGIAEQKAKLVATSFTENRTYTRVDGWNSVSVNVPSQTINNKSLTKIFANDSVDIINRTELGQKKWYAYHAAEQPELPSGYTGFYPVTLSVGVDITSVYVSGYTDGVEVASGGSYQQGYDDGEAAQKAKLVATGVTENGIYSRPDGYSSFVVNVAQTGHTDQELLDAFNSGYTNGKTEGYNSGWTNGYNSGKTDGYNSGWTNGYNSGWTDGYISGYTDGSGLGEPLTVDVLSAGTILWVANPSETPLSIEYKVNDGAWTSITATTAGTPINVAAGDEVKFRGDNARYCTQRSGSAPELTFGNHINMTAGKYAVRGNIMSMISSTNYDSLTTFESTSIYAFLGFFANSLGLVDASGLLLPATTLCTECYYAMFAGCTNLVSAPALPATVLAYGCYLQMFRNCTSLAQVSALPATTLDKYSYSSMFAGCTSLTVAPAIAATTVADNCCLYMFDGCTSLTQVSALLATTMAGSCYQRMFYGCTSLTTAPSLPATTLANMCYKEMFYNCSALTQAPSLPATALTDSCYNGMFYNCKSLTTAPELPAIILAPGCYAWMFYGANNLNYIKCMGITFGSNSTTGWAQNVASSGTFVKDPNATWQRGVNGIPTNWTVVDAS